MRRLALVVPLLLVVAPGATGASATGASATGASPASGHALTAPNPLELGNAVALAAPGRTPVVTSLNVRSLASWGGQYVTTTGETVTIQVSDSYPQDPARPHPGRGVGPPSTRGRAYLRCTHGSRTRM